MEIFEVTDKMTFENVNVRTEKHGDEDVLAVDLKFSGYFTAEEIVPLFGIDNFDLEKFKDLFWDEEGHQLFHAEHAISWDYSLEGMKVELLKDRPTTGQVQVFVTNSAKIVRFHGLFSLAYGFNLTFTVQTEITSIALGELAAYLKDELIVAIEAIQGSLDLDSNPDLADAND